MGEYLVMLIYVFLDIMNDFNKEPSSSSSSSSSFVVITTAVVRDKLKRILHTHRETIYDASQTTDHDPSSKGPEISNINHGKDEAGLDVKKPKLD